MWPFSRKSLIPSEYVEWQFASYAWLLRNFGGFDQFKQTALVTPTSEFFPDTQLKEHDFVQHIFDHVQKLAGMESWPCILEAQEEELQPVEIQPGHTLVNETHAPSGTFSLADGTESAVITYNPNLTNRPMELVATFAHELAHYLTGTAREEPPGTWEVWELTTDLTAVFLGFGIFSANSAFNFQQFGDSVSSGWRAQRQGYLPESSLIFGLAIFVKLLDCDEQIPVKHLKPSLGKLYKIALAELSAYADRINDLRTINESKQ